MANRFTRVLEVILGLALLVFGANGFLQFMPAMEFNNAGSSFLGALFGTGYIFPIMSVVWIIAGLLFVFNRARAFAAILIFPISLNLVLFHLLLDGSNSIFAYIIFLVNVYLIYAYWKVYRPLFN